MEESKKPVWIWVVVALLALLVIYPLSFGPAMWLFSTGRLPIDVVLFVYQPMLWLGYEIGGPSVTGVESVLSDGIRWYVDFWGWATNTEIIVPIPRRS